jgi:hypothetical protein
VDGRLVIVCSEQPRSGSSKNNEAGYSKVIIRKSSFTKFAVFYILSLLEILEWADSWSKYFHIVLVVRDEIGQHESEECYGGEGHTQHIQGALANQDTNGDHQAAPGGSEEKTRCMP